MILPTLCPAGRAVARDSVDGAQVELASTCMCRAAVAGNDVTGNRQTFSHFVQVA